MANNTPSPYMVMVFHCEKDMKPLKYPYVKSIYYLVKWVLNKEQYNYLYMNIYNRKTGKYLCRHYRYDEKGNLNFINDKPTL